MSVPIIVTGGAGYIGSHICKALAQAGFLPITVDNLSRGHASLVQFGPLEQIDITDTTALADMFKRYQPAAVIHCAGYIAIGESTTNPTLYYQQNVVGTLRLLDAMQQANIQHIIFSSSCAVHGLPSQQPIVETMPYAPISPYGNSKMMAELMIKDAAAAHNLRYVIFRYFNACGADAEGTIGECHEPETHLIPLALQAAMGSTPLQLFGDDHATPDGTAIRDYIHVTDIAEAHVRGLQYLLADGASDIFNIGQGTGYSVKDVIIASEHVLQKPVPHSIAPRRAGDAAILIADTKKIRERLGFVAKHSSLKNIITTAYSWERKRKSNAC